MMKQEYWHIIGGSTQPAEIMYYHIKESLNYQNPKIVICSVRSLFWENEKTIDEVEASVRNGMDYTPLSLAKLEAAYNISKESEWQTMLSFVFPIVKYHNTWTSMSLFKNDIQYDHLHGQNAIYMQKSFTEDPRNSYNSTIEPKVSNNSLYWYKEIATLCSDNGIRLLFLEMPAEDWTVGKYNVILDIADECEADVLDFNVENIMKQCNLMWEEDFYDGYHLNTRGSLKASEYLAQYIKDKYGLNASVISQNHKKQIEKDIMQFEEEQKKAVYEVVN